MCDIRYNLAVASGVRKHGEWSTRLGPGDGGRRSAPPSRWVVRAVIGVLLLGSGIGVYYWLRVPNATPIKAALPGLAELNEDPEDLGAPPNPGYLGPKACTPCHASRVHEFLQTIHARACRRPQDGPMAPGFDKGLGRYITAESGLRFDMTHEGNDYFQTAIQQSPNGENRVKSRIDLVYGANKADEVFFTWRGDRLYELMTVWLHPNNQWANTSFNRYGGGGFARETTIRCLECHTTWFAHVTGTANQYQPDSFILGTTCEKCHGPGKDHVEFHRTHPRATAAHAILNPANLSRERLLEVCTQCHANFTKPRGPANKYRPGEPLDQYYRLAQTKYRDEDHVANQIKYLRQSKCFQKSETMTCVTCHDPHKPHAAGDRHRATSRA